MPTLHLLGTGAALSSSDRTTTMLAVAGRGTVVIDCGGDVIQRLLSAGLSVDSITLLLLTHEHPDHVSGFPLFMEKIWLARRRRPIPVVGPRPALDQARRIFQQFNTSGWKGMPSIAWREVPLEENATVWEDEEWRITGAPGKHSVPVMGFRVEAVGSGRTVAYSADTEPHEPILRLSQDADILVHEATGALRGHTSASGAAEIAAKAGARHLVLVHLPPTPDPDDLARATAIFPRLELGADGNSYPF